MKRTRLLRCLVQSLILTMLLTSCGNQVTAGSGTAQPTANATSATPGSASSPASRGGQVVCVDWVWFETPQDQYDKAALVLIGKSVGQVGETTIYGSKAPTHLVEVEQVLKGNPGEGNLRISSMPQTCPGSESHLDGDPLDTSQRVILFVIKKDGDWFTMTPSQGVLVFPQRSGLPFRQ